MNYKKFAAAAVLSITSTAFGQGPPPTLTPPAAPTAAPTAAPERTPPLPKKGPRRTPPSLDPVLTPAPTPGGGNPEKPPLPAPPTPS
jgi:hypothetical protein